MRIFSGHLVNFYLLSRCALSAMGAVYTFANQNLGKFAKFDAETRCELRVCRDLLALVRHRMDKELYVIAYCSDASTCGYALHDAVLSQAEQHEAGRWKERRLG